MSQDSGANRTVSPAIAGATNAAARVMIGDAAAAP